MPPEGVAFLFTLTIIGSTVLLFPLVRALAERIRSKNVDAGVKEVQVLREDLLGEIQQARREIGELGERVDFTERLLAKKSQTWRSGWTSPNASSRGQRTGDGRHHRRFHPDHRHRRLFRVDDFALAGGEGVRGAPQAWSCASRWRRNRRRARRVGRNRGAVAPRGGGTGGASRFYGTAPRPAEGCGAAATAADVTLPAETGIAGAA